MIYDEEKFKERVKERILKASKSSSFYIGSDSSVYRRDRRDKHGNVLRDKNGKVLVDKYAKYSLIFIIHYDSNKGCGWEQTVYELPEYGNLKQRLLNEANYAIGLAVEIMDLIGDRHLEVHFDINPDPRHKSNVAVKEALAYARGMGLDARIKPEAFAASYAADKLT